MKKTLSLLLVLAMVLTSFTAVFAADETEKTPGEILQEIGVLKGNAEGDLMLEKEVSRQDMIVLLSRLLGQEDEAKAFTGETTFKDIEDPYYVPYIAWAQANELTNGVAEGGEAFGFGRSVTQQEVLAFLLRALGYGFDEVEFENVAAKAAELKLIDDAKADLTVASTREVLAELSLKALKTKVKDSDKTLAEKLELTLPEASKLEVKEVAADNLKEIKVVFNKSVDEDSAIDLNNYETDAGDISDAVYSAEDYTVTLTLKEAIDKDDEGDYELTIDGVKDDKTVLDVTKDFTISDNAIPEVVEVVGLGKKAVKIVVSEPIDGAKASNFKVDGKTVYGSILTAGKDLIVKTYSDLSIGDHELTASGLTDYAGFKSVTTKHSFTVVEDTDAPTVAEVKAPALERVIVTFSEDVDSSTVTTKSIYYKNSGEKVYPDSVKALAGNKYEFAFTGEDKGLPVYETTLYIEGVKDYSGNKMEAAEVAVKASIDETRPEVREVEISTDRKTVTITFTKYVNLTNAKFSVLDEDDDKVAISDIVPENKTTNTKSVDIKLGVALKADEDYTLKITGVKDTNKYANYMADYSEILSTSDYGKPSLTNVVIGNPKDVGDDEVEYKVTLYFDKAMDLSTVSDPSNYLVELDGKTINNLSDLDNDIDVIKSDGSVVVLYVTIDEDSEVTGVAGLNLKSNNGKVLKDYGIIKHPEEYKTLAVDKVTATAKDTIEIEFSKKIVDADTDAFTVSNATVDEVDIDGNVVTLTLDDEDLKANGENTLTIAKEGVEAFDGETNKTELNFAKLDDEISPSIDSITLGTAAIDGTIITLKVNFDEKLGTLNEASWKEDLVVKRVEGDTKVAYNITDVTDNVMTITIDADQDGLRTIDKTKFSVATKAEVRNIVDAIGNKAATESSATSPMVEGIKDAVGKTNYASVATLPDINVANGTAKDAITFPTEVKVTLENGKTVDVNITAWDNGDPEYNPTTAGTYKFKGTLEVPEGYTNTDNLTATVNVIVAQQ